MKVKLLALGSLLATISAIIQLFPIFFSELFILFTMLSTIPIYYISRIKVQLGIMTYICAGIIVFFFSVHECIIFIFTNGIFGLLLGTYDYFYKNKLLVIILTALSFVIPLLILNFVIGIPIFVMDSKLLLIYETLIIFGFSLIYTLVYYLILSKIMNRIKILKQ